MDNALVCLFNACMAKWSFEHNLNFWGWFNLVFSALNFAWLLVKLFD